MSFERKNTVGDCNEKYKAVVPWTRTGKVRYARWDGGAIEAAKAALSGWYYITDPKALEATTNWYEGSNSLELLLSGGINWIWATYSVGFSLQSEEATQNQLKIFVRKCHEHGIRVTAYMSMDNLFIEDMRKNEPRVDEWLQQDRNGKPIAYGAARYSGEPTRLLACLNSPGWRDYLAIRIKMALEDGCDGIEYDNQWTDCRCEICSNKWERFQKEYSVSAWPWPEDPDAQKLTSEEQLKLICMYDRFRNKEYEEIYDFVRSIAIPQNPDILIYGNFNTGYNTYTFPKNNAVSTEDGFEPGIVEGMLVQNTGYLRCLSGAGAGWKPVRIEYGRGRGRGQLAKRINAAGVGATRFVAMEPIKHQLSMAEAFSHGISFQITPEGEFLRDLYFRTEEAMENWMAISRYNSFFAVHEELYTDVVTATRIVSIHNSCFRRISGGGFAQRPALIGELSRRKVVLDVRYDQDIESQDLKAYDVMLLADMCVISFKMLQIVRDFSERGGRIIATALTGWYDRYFNHCERNLLENIPNVQWKQDPSRKILIGIDTSKQTNVMEQFPVDADEDIDPQLADELADTLLQFHPLPVKIECPDYVMINMTYDNNGRLLIHFLNYDDGQRPEVKVQFNKDEPSTVEWLTPDESEIQAERTSAKSICIKELVNYGVMRCSFARMM